MRSVSVFSKKMPISDQDRKKNVFCFYESIYALRMSDEFKVIKIERFDTKGIRHAYDDVGRQTFNNRVSSKIF